MKRLITLSALVVLAATLTVSANPLPNPSYQFRTVIGTPCGGDLPSDLCTAAGDAIAQTKVLLGNYSQQGWQLISATPVVYAAGNEAVVFLLRLPFNPMAPAPKPQRFEVVMGMPCGQGPTGLPAQLCTANGTTVEQTLNGHNIHGWKLVSTTSCSYRYDQGSVGMAVYLLSK